MAFHTFAYAVEAVYKLFLTLNPVGRQVNYLIFYFSKSTVKFTNFTMVLLRIGLFNCGRGWQFTLNLSQHLLKNKYLITA